MPRDRSKILGCLVDEDCSFDINVDYLENKEMEQNFRPYSNNKRTEKNIVYSNDIGEVIKGLYLSDVKPYKLVEIICPTCRKKRKIPVPEDLIANSDNLTTLTIPGNIICDHNFQAFIDKEFHVRGYQKGHYQVPPLPQAKDKKTLKKVYEKFWKYISDYNTEFEDLIAKDPRRPKK